MNKMKLLFFTVILVISFMPFCSAAELSSMEIKNIEKGIEKIKSQARGIQRQGYDELRTIGSETAPYLIELAKDKSANRESRILACNLLGELKAKDAVPALLYVQKNKSYTMRAAACKALGRIAEPATIKPLLGMLDDEEALVRKSTIYALINFDNNIIPPKVTRFLKDKNGSVRFAAITLLSDKLDRRTAEAIRETFLKEKLYEIRLIAAKTLGELKDKGAVDILMEAAIEEPDHFIRKECLISLGKIGDRKAMPALIEALKDDYKDTQLKASYILKDFTGKDFGRDHEKWSSWYKGRK